MHLNFKLGNMVRANMCITCKMFVLHFILYSFGFVSAAQKINTGST